MKPLFIEAEAETTANVMPKNGKSFTLKELQHFCDGNVQLITLPNGLQLWMNEEGKLNGLVPNRIATLLWQVIYYGYEVGADDFVVGDCLICPAHFTENEQ